ncbi:MAG TPA: metallophosphoesterase [archaeon]|nr:metallophosphoesterase [archaeon]
MDLKFLTGEPALLAGRTLFVADIHVGIEHEFRKSGLNMPSQTQNLLSRIESLLENTHARRLVLIGDIKHKVPGISWQETREVPVFLQRLAEKAELHVVPGNHDGRIAEFVPKGVKLYPMEGSLIQDKGIVAGRRNGERRRPQTPSNKRSPSIEPLVYVCHGHAWPDPAFLQAKYLIMSHSHPQVEFRDRLGYTWRERIWIRAALDSKKIREKYPAAKSIPELIVMPAFNPLSGGIPVNRKKRPEEQHRKEGGTTHIGSGSTFSPERSPILKSAKMKTAKIYMLDGTYLGELGKL